MADEVNEVIPDELGVEEVETSENSESVAARSSRNALSSLSTLAILVLTIAVLILGKWLINLEDSLNELASNNQIATTNGSLYDQPQNLQAVIDKVKESTVTIYCGNSSGSGWAINLSDDETTDIDDDYPYELITNFHVIEECIYNDDVWFSRPGSVVEYRAYIYNWDKREDMAMLMTSEQVPHLKLAAKSDKPAQGHWVMAVGSPGVWGFDLNGSVTFGRVTNVDDYVIVTDAAINPGNSGGPLVNSHGKVVATNSWGEFVDEWDNINYSQGNPVLCRKLVDCSGVSWDW